MKLKALNILKVLLLPCIAVISISCSNANPFELYRFYAMGTWIEITLQPNEESQLALREIEDFLYQYEKDFYPWAEGELKELNTSITDAETIFISPLMLELIEKSQFMFNASEGRFDPSIGPLVELWGFNNMMNQMTIPEDDDIQNLLTERLTLNDIAVNKNNNAPSVRPIKSGTLLLDFGGIAKGQSINEIRKILLNFKHENFVINAGGDLLVGTTDSKNLETYSIGIRSPREESIAFNLEIYSNESVFTSGDYERFFEEDNNRLHHLINPINGYPWTETASVTVIHDDPIIADAAATALFFTTQENWLAITKILDIAMAMRIDADGSIDITENMRERIFPNIE